MPKILFKRGFSFFFYSNENNEPAHIHVSKGTADGKIWLEPTSSIAYLYGFTSGEEKDIIEITTKNFQLFKSKWNEYFSK
jgi:Domain of unknown function (DUF4160)